MITSTASPATYTDCSNQGISPGWEDIYDSTLDCQWLDITGVLSGNYILRITANRDGIFAETNFINNASDIQVTIP